MFRAALTSAARYEGRSDASVGPQTKFSGLTPEATTLKAIASVTGAFLARKLDLWGHARAAGRSLELPKRARPKCLNQHLDVEVSNVDTWLGELSAADSVHQRGRCALDNAVDLIGHFANRCQTPAGLAILDLADESRGRAPSK
jgi:hypothetical protein